MRFEHDDRWYEIEREETRVYLRWGRSRGNSQVIALATEADARLEVENRCKDLVKRGYRRVDAPVPDANAALTRQLPLGDSPRYLFTKGSAFGWVEARGELVISVDGHRTQASSATPIEQRHPSPAAAIKARDAAIAKYLARGFELETFDVVDPPPAPLPYKKPRRLQQKLADVEALEELVIENPDDPDTWSVLADKLLEAEDPRGRLLREHVREDQDRLRDELLPVLLGSKHVALHHRLDLEVWHGGYLLECWFYPDASATIEALLAAPATRLLRLLGLRASTAARSLEHAKRVAAIAPRTLRDLSFTPDGSRVVTLDAGMFAGMQLRSLETTSLLPCRNVAALPSLRTLDVREESFAQLRELFVGTTNLEVLQLVFDDNDGTTTRRRYFTELRDGFARLAAFAPRLKQLHVGLPEEAVEAVREVVDASVAINP